MSEKALQLAMAALLASSSATWSRTRSLGLGSYSFIRASPPAWGVPETT
jgi:hypothetical protein